MSDHSCISFNDYEQQLYNMRHGQKCFYSDLKGYGTDTNSLDFRNHAISNKNRLLPKTNISKGNVINLWSKPGKMNR